MVKREKETIDLITKLRKLLANENEGIGRSAALALGEIGLPAIPTLMNDLRYGNEWVRRNVAYAFGKIGAPAVPALIKALGSRDDVVVKSAAKALVQIGLPAVPALIGALNNRYEYSRLFAAKALGGIGLPAVPALIEALGDKKIMREAAEVLGEIGAPAVPALIGALGYKNRGVRVRAADALVRIGPKDSADLKLIATAAREAKKEGRPVDTYRRVYSAWSKKLNERADALVLDKKFPLPKVGKPDNMGRVLRVRRVGA